MWFSSSLTNSAELASELNKISCTEGGYNVVSSGKHNNVSRIRCSRGLKARNTRALKNTTQTTRATSVEDCCQFRIPINYDVDADRFFIRRNCNACFTHNGHIRIDPEHRATTTKNLDAQSMTNIKKLIEKHCSSSTIIDFIDVQTGIKISKQNVAKLRSKILLNSDKKREGETTAETMLRMLHEKDGLRYTVFTGTYQQATDLVTVRRRNRKSKTNKNDEAGKTILFLIELLTLFS